MRVILFLLFLYLVVRIVRMSLVRHRAGRGAFSRTYTFTGGANPFGNNHRPAGRVKKRPNLDNLEDAEFEEIEDDDTPDK